MNRLSTAGSLHCVTMSSLDVSASLVPFFFFFSSRRRHTRSLRDWSSDVCSSDLAERQVHRPRPAMALARTEDTRGRDLHSVQRIQGYAARDQHRAPTTVVVAEVAARDRKSTRLNSSHVEISYAVFCLKKKRGYYSCLSTSCRLPLGIG